MPSVTRPDATYVSPSRASASNSRSASPNRLAMASADAASLSRSDESRENGARSRTSHPCAAHSSTPSSRLSARAIHPLATAKLPWNVPWRKASQRAMSAASTGLPRRRYAPKARSFSSIARSYSPWKWAASLRPSSASAVSPCSPARSKQERALAQSAAASASRPLRTRSSAPSVPMAPCSQRLEHSPIAALEMCGCASSARGLGNQLHQQVVVPAAVRPPLVAVQDAHAAEADRGVGADGALVADRRVDGEAVVPAVPDEPSDRGSQRLGPEAPVLVWRREDDVQAGVAVVGLGLLADPEPARERAPDLDGEGGAIVAQVATQLLPVAGGAPPLPHAGRRDDGGERFHVLVGERA